MADIKIKDLPLDVQSSIDLEDYEVYNSNGVRIIDDGEWIDNGKYSHMTTIFAYEDKFYSWSISRSGSYFTDYDVIANDYVTEVKPVEKIIIVYENI